MNRIENIDSYKKNDEKLSTAGQPTESELGLLADDGFEVIINIRPESEMLDLFDGKSIVENLGMKYFQIPVTFDTLTNEIIVKFIELMEEQKGKRIFLHCRKNVRVSVLLALYQIIKLGWEKEDAFNELREMVDVDPMLEDFIDFHINNYSE